MSSTAPATIDDCPYLDKPEQWDELAARLRRARVIGLDTEFHGVDVRKQSTVGRSRVHVWSVAIRTRRQSPLGFHRARGWVLPGAALGYGPLKAVLEDPAVTKCVHNQAVDDHSIHNHGVDLQGCIDTLHLARWAWPELLQVGGPKKVFDLKSLMVSKLRREPVCTFKDLVSDERTVQTVRQRKRRVTVCSCGVEGCRKRKGHDKTVNEMTEEYTTERKEKFQHPLESIVPGHPRWDLLVRYSAEDAIAALEVYELEQQAKDPAPFPYGGERPKFSQAVCDEIVKMERTGFPVDTEYAAKTAKRAEDEEREELLWLRVWYRLNLAEDGDWSLKTDEEIDAIWSSQPQKVELFDYLGFPRSPIWKKGRVKPGDVKLDGTALEWIAKNAPDTKQLIDHLFHLQRIRSGLKYLVKIRDCGGWVNPICGSGDDDDDRFGAKTGRLGIKGVLEAQQLPKRDEVDLYQIRKAVVANVCSPLQA